MVIGNETERTVNRNERNTLMWAVAFGRIKEATEILEKEPLLLNERTKSGETALSIAVHNGQTEMVKLLLSYPGLNISEHDYTGNSPVKIALQKNNLAIAGLLSRQQENIIHKLIKFLNIQAVSKGKLFTKSDEIELNEMMAGIRPGQCNGLVGNWIVRRLRGEISIFLGNRNLVLNWDEGPNTLVAHHAFLKKIFKSVLNDIQWFQNKSGMMRYHVPQKNIVQMFEIAKQTRQKSLTEEFSLDFPLKRSEFKKVLNMILHEGKAIYLSGHNHTMGLFVEKRQGKLVYIAFDPNDQEGEKEFDDTNTLQEYIMNSLFRNFGYKTSLMPLNISVLDEAGNAPYPYPKTGNELVASFLQENNDANRVVEYPDGTDSAMTFAILAGNIGMISTLLKQKEMNINFRDNIEWPAILYAVLFQQIDTAKMIVEDPRFDPRDFLPAILMAYDNHDIGMITTLEHARQIKGLDKTLRPQDLAWEQFLIALVKNDEAGIKQGLEQNVDINHQDSTGMNAILYAVSFGRPKMLELLLSRKEANVHLTDKTQNTLLMYAVRSKNKNILETVMKYYHLQDGKFNLKNANGLTAFMIAVQDGNPAVLAVFKKIPEININSVDSSGETPLMQTIRNKNLAAFLEIMKFDQLKINTKNKQGATALMVAIEENELEMVSALLKVSGINLDLSNYEGDTPLSLAVKLGRMEILRQLMSKSTVKISKKENWRLMLVAEQQGHRQITEFLAGIFNVDLSSNLIKGHLAAARGDIDTLNQLLQTNSLDINASILGNSLLQTATIYGQTELVNWLLQIEGLDINYQNREGNTALMTAVEDNNFSIVQALFQKGAELSPQNKQGLKAVNIAENQDNEEMVSFMDEILKKKEKPINNKEDSLPPREPEPPIHRKPTI